MNYKRLFIGIIAVICVIFFVKVYTKPFQSHTPIVVSKNIQNNVKITFILDSGTSIATYDGVLAQTPYDALVKIGNAHSFTVEKKQYDFGVFVEKIGNRANTKDNAWIYYVNGKSGDVAADKKILRGGDAVEWRYTKPLY
jgi:hypothetical protein